MSQDNIIAHNFRVDAEMRKKLLNQIPFLLWFTGLSGSGKSTLANEVEMALYEMNKSTYLLDGDNTRQGINSDLDFSEDSRTENIRRVSEISKLMLDAGLITLASFISPFAKDREFIRNTVGKDRFIEIYVQCPIEECEKRDVKGLYAKARSGEIANFTGISSPYEEPQNPQIVVHSHTEKLGDSKHKVIEYLITNNLIG